MATSIELLQKIRDELGDLPETLARALHEMRGTHLEPPDTELRRPALEPIRSQIPIVGAMGIDRGDNLPEREEVAPLAEFPARQPFLQRPEMHDYPGPTP